MTRPGNAGPTDRARVLAFAAWCRIASPPSSRTSRRWPSGSAPPVIGCTSSAGPCVTCWSGATRARRRRRHHRRPATRDQGRSWPAGPTPSGPRASASARSAPATGTRSYEITTHRAEAYDPDSRKPDVVFADAVEVDLSRRDFTVNAMALELTTRGARRSSTPSAGPPTWPPDVLRTPLRPEESFSDDPLRMLRAARFLARLPAGAGARRWSPRSRPCTTACRSCRPSASATSWTSSSSVDRPGPGLWFVIDTGLAEEFLPELPAMRLEQDPIHRHKDVLSHTIAVVENVRPPATPGRTSTSGARAWPRCSTTSASRRPAATARARA